MTIYGITWKRGGLQVIQLFDSCPEQWRAAVFIPQRTLLCYAIYGDCSAAGLNPNLALLRISHDSRLYLDFFASKNPFQNEDSVAFAYPCLLLFAASSSSAILF